MSKVTCWIFSGEKKILAFGTSFYAQCNLLFKGFYAVKPHISRDMVRFWSICILDYKLFVWLLISASEFCLSTNIRPALGLTQLPFKHPSSLIMHSLHARGHLYVLFLIQHNSIPINRVFSVVPPDERGELRVLECHREMAPLSLWLRDR